MKVSISGWYTLTRKKVVHFNPQNDTICQQASKEGRHCQEWLSANCSNCGKFILHENTEILVPHLIDDETKRAQVSHAIRKRQAASQQVRIQREILDQLLKSQLPSVSEQANNLIIHFAQNSKEPGAYIDMVAPHYIGIAGAISAVGVKSLIDYLCDAKYLDLPKHDLNVPMEHRSYFLTVHGWMKYEELKKQSTNSTIIFMAMQFGDAELDRIIDNYFRPAVSQTGFRLLKLTDEQRAGLIDDQLRVQINRARLLIADLTHANNGAYWEAGFAEGLGIPVIYTCKQSVFDDPKTKPHFDTNHYLTVPWDPYNLQAASDKLKATIRATLPKAAKMEDG